VVGVAGLRPAHARAAAAGVPLVAIGGITRDNAAELVGLVDAVAVVADLVPPTLVHGTAAPASDVLREVTARAQALHDLFAPPLPIAGAAR
jgi:thiamine monophosphate synthase